MGVLRTLFLHLWLTLLCAWSHTEFFFDWTPLNLSFNVIQIFTDFNVISHLCTEISPSHLTWMCAHIHPFLCLHKLIFSWSCGWLQENKQALILLKHDLHQTYVLYFNLYKLRSLSLTVFSCPLPLPSSVFETCDIYKLHWMPSTGQKASLSKRESEG